MTNQGLDVATLAAMPCTKCGGIGEWEEQRIPSVPWRRRSPDFVTVRCEWCDGTGEEPCGNCGEAAAVVETELGPYCARCAEMEAREAARA